MLIHIYEKNKTALFTADRLSLCETAKASEGDGTVMQIFFVRNFDVPA